MKKKSIAVAVLASCMVLSATFTGCSLVSTDNKADMSQEIAKVNITKAEDFKNNELYAYKDAITEDKTIIKRDLVSYFINVGYAYINNYGYTYEDTFNMLMDAIVDNAILVQYSTMELLKNNAETSNQTAQKVVGDYLAIKDANSAKEKIARYESILEPADIKLATYKLYAAINSAIDNYEKTIIKDEDEYKGTATRTTPVNLETEQDDYYPKDKDGNLDYNIYTGYEGEGFNNLLDNSGIYKDDAIDGTTRATRVKAYNRFLDNLNSNDLIPEEELGDLKNINKLSYIQNEYIAQLESRIINKYYKVYEDKQEKVLLEKAADSNKSYIENIYNELLKKQTESYKDASAFDTAMGSMSSSSFLLYSPETNDDNEIDGAKDYKLNGEAYSEETYGRFGFVYNILLPFNAKQSKQLTELKSIMNQDEDEDYYYTKRNEVLQQIKTEDQRAAWFNGANDYSFKASDPESKHNYYGASDYLFFEGNLNNSEDGGRYKKLQAYYGEYSYNGSVYENEDGSYTLIGNPLDINGMLDEFSAYINYVLTGDKNGGKVSMVNRGKDENSSDYYYATTKFHKKNADGEEEIDYSKFLYAYGKVDLSKDGNKFNKNDLLYSGAASNQYNAMSAVNELQFAYTTDTGVLSNYVGYNVSAYDTNYIKEFEYAAKLAISAGEGAFTVCAGDYGWHLIYVTYVFGGGNTYNDFDWSADGRIRQEGTFENLFFEWIKGNDLSDITTSRRNKITSEFNKEDVTVIKYQKRYQDLLDLKNDN